jgi:hypothetical protein
VGVAVECTTSSSFSFNKNERDLLDDIPEEQEEEDPW